MVLKKLREMDEVAYVRFASVYRQFRDVSEFSHEVKVLLQDVDRIIAILANESSIREVIAFPKTETAVDLMADAPSTVDQKQLRELHLKSSK